MVQSAIAVPLGERRGGIRTAGRLVVAALGILGGVELRAQVESRPRDAAKPESARPQAEIPWRRDLAAARTEARALKKPLCVVFRCEA